MVFIFDFEMVYFGSNTQNAVLAEKKKKQFHVKSKLPTSPSSSPKGIKVLPRHATGLHRGPHP